MWVERHGSFGVDLPNVNDRGRTYTPMIGAMRKSAKRRRIEHFMNERGDGPSSLVGGVRSLLAQVTRALVVAPAASVWVCAHSLFAGDALL